MCFHTFTWYAMSVICVFIQSTLVVVMCSCFHRLTILGHEYFNVPMICSDLISHPTPLWKKIVQQFLPDGRF